MPTGGLFLWTKLPLDDSREFAQVALRYGVIALPGTTMSASEEQSAFIRLPFLAEPDKLRVGVTRLAAAWRHYKSSGGTARAPNVAIV